MSPRGERYSDSMGVAPVTAAILLVAITVAIAAVGGMYFVESGESLLDSSSTSVGIQSSYSPGTYSAMVVGGDADSMSVLVNGNKARTVSNVAAGDVISVTAKPNDSIVITVTENGATQTLLTTQASRQNSAGAALEIETVLDFEDGSKAPDDADWGSWQLDSFDISAQSSSPIRGSYSGEMQGTSGGSQTFVKRGDSKEIIKATWYFRPETELESGEELSSTLRNGSNVVVAMGMSESETLLVQHSDTGISLTPGESYIVSVHDVDYSENTVDIRVVQADTGEVLYNSNDEAFVREVDSINRFGVELTDGNGDGDHFHFDDVVVVYKK